MNIVQENFQLKTYNSFGLNIKTKYFLEFDNIEILKPVLTNEKFRLIQKFVLGGGSNVLFTNDFPGLVLHPVMNDILVVEETDEFIKLKVGAGKNWDEFVQFCVNSNYYGVENLSLIYGNVGASPVQNIGAYGVEVKDVISEVEVFDMQTFQIILLSASDCSFGYRNSIFKTVKDRFIVTNVIYKLNKQISFNLTYADLVKSFENENEITLKKVREIICKIREQKLPNPEIIGNAGSFFKNPVVEKSISSKIKEKYPNAPVYKVSDTHEKLAAGWLIEQSGWKGKRIGDAGVHTNQALVLVNYGSATSSEIWAIAQSIIDDVKTKFEITLEPEVIVI